MVGKFRLVIFRMVQTHVFVVVRKPKSLSQGPIDFPISILVMADDYGIFALRHVEYRELALVVLGLTSTFFIEAATPFLNALSLS